VCMWCAVKAIDEGVLDTVLSMCHTNVPDVVRMAALQYIAAISSHSNHFCDALTDDTRRSTLIKLLTLVTSSDASVCTFVST